MHRKFFHAAKRRRRKEGECRHAEKALSPLACTYPATHGCIRVERVFPPLLPSLPFETSNFRHRSSSSSLQVLFDGCRRPFYSLCLSKFNGFVLSISGPAAHLCLVPLYPLPPSHFKTLFREKVGQSRRCPVVEDETTGEGMGEKE